MLSAGLVRVYFVATFCPSEGLWYQHFETGICAQMGDIVTQDQAYTIEVLLALVEMYKQEWQTYYLQKSLLACMLLLVSSIEDIPSFECAGVDQLGSFSIQCLIL
jgi:hypothetical protein